MTPEEIAEKHPQAAYLRSMDKIGYRYPRGESYFDLISRLEPCIQEMESRTRPRRQSPSHPALDLRLSHRRRSRTRAGNEHLLPKRRLRDHARRVVRRFDHRGRPRPFAARTIFVETSRRWRKSAIPPSERHSFAPRSRSRERVSVPSFHRLIHRRDAKQTVASRRASLTRRRLATMSDTPQCRRRHPTRRPRPLPRTSARSWRLRFVTFATISDFSPVDARAPFSSPPPTRAPHRRSRRVRRSVVSSGR